MSYRYYKGFKDEYFTKNRKLMMVEYDDDKNIIDVRRFGDDELSMFLCNMWNEYKQIEIARKKHREQFSEEQLELIHRIIINSAGWRAYESEKELSFILDEDVELFKEILKEPIEKIEFALKLANPMEGSFNVQLASPYSRMKLNFLQALEFINNREGIYYTVTNEGKRRWDFVDKPTLKQYRYQLQKNGERTVFLSFKDWKEYLVNESDL